MKVTKENIDFYMDYYDLHCHIDLMPSMVMFANATQKESIGILGVTTTPKAYEKEIITLSSFGNIRIALGLHPQLVSERYSELSIMEKLVSTADYIGEIGLDFSRQYYASKEKQIDVFDNVIKWCCEQGGKVISIHSVHSDKIILDILEKYRCTANNDCILHWFSGSSTQLQRAIENGCYFSVNGVVLKSSNGQKLVRNTPPENILIETDAPFVNGIRSVQQLKSELMQIESSLVSIFGNDILSLVHTKSKALLSIM